MMLTPKGSYDIRSIREALSEKQRRYLLLCHAFTGCDTVSAISGHGKTSLFDKFVQGRLTNIWMSSLILGLLGML